jgi:hypothetical protein
MRIKPGKPNCLHGRDTDSVHRSEDTFQYLSYSAALRAASRQWAPIAYSGEAGHPFRTKPITDSGKPITDSGQADHLDDDAGVLYFAAFLAPVKLSTLQMDSPPSLRR